MFLRLQERHGFKGEHIVAFALLFNTFSWYFIGLLMIDKVGYFFSEVSFENLYLRLVYTVSIIASALVGSVSLAKVRKVRFFYVWLLFGIIASLFLATPMVSSLFTTLVMVMLLGSSMGLGMPLCLSYFTESTPIENRGKLSGIILFATIFSAPFVSIIMSTLDLVSSAVILALWRGWSLPMLFFTPKKSDDFEPRIQRTPSLISVFQNRTFVLYFVAWLMFTLVDSFGSVFVNFHVGEIRFLIGIVEPSVAGVSALIGGVLSDQVGRKRVMIFGFVSLGVAYAMVGLAAHIWIAWLFYFIIDGIALGLLVVLFVMVLWGDLPRNGSEKFYAVGVAPFFLTQMLSLLLAPYVALIPETSAFSLAAFFLFIAVIPLLYARETLPEKKIQQRQLKIYTEEALKLKQKIKQK
ncbi:MAG: MFS transporter [Candidatus Bathyarchaeota archaeon]|nr:MFS transporter [Candidatus Bathyarchaeota archaeon]